MTSGFDKIKFEVPTDKVSVRAQFYCLFGGTFDEFNPIQPMGEYSPFLHFNPKLAGGGPLRKKISLPGALAPYWQAEELVGDPEAYHEFICPVQLQDQRFLPHFTDYMSVAPIPLVTQRLRSLIESIDPGKNFFFDAMIHDEHGDLLSSLNYSHWLPRRRFLLKGDVQTERLRLHFPGRWSNSKISWLLTHDPETRTYFSEIPFSGYAFGLNQTCMNQHTFNEIRRGKFTGFVENTAGHEADRKLHENVGHII